MTRERSAAGRRAALFIGAVVVGSAGACSTAQLRELGELTQRADVQTAARLAREAMPISADTEREIGFGIAAGVAGRYGVVEDAELLRYLSLVGHAVAQQSPRYGEVPFHFGLLDTDDVNAFAAPGGYVFITRGALALMRSEAELAAVLAHEVGHIDQKHVLEEIRRSAVLQQVRDESQLRGEVMDRVAEAGTTVLFTGLSREDEMEADSLAVLYAAGTGYAAAGMLDFLAHLREAERSGGGGLREWIATHPAAEDRIRALEPQVRRVEASAGGPGASGAERFQRIMEAGTGAR